MPELRAARPDSAGDDFERAWRRRFEQFGRACDDDAGIAGWTDSGLDTRFRRFRGLLQAVRPGELWLDAGCGAGTYARYLASVGLRVAGFDYSLPTIEKAKRRESRGIEFAVADVTRLPLADGAVDGAICFGVLQALSSPEPAIRELARTLRPGGELWVDALNAECLPTRVRQSRERASGRPAHLRYDYPRELVRVFEAAGFNSIRVHWVPILPGSLRKLQRMAEWGWIRAALAALPPVGSAFSHAFVVVGKRAGGA